MTPCMLLMRLHWFGLLPVAALAHPWMMLV
eukprot:COSAG01_NODE_3943_length_5509_cov_6.170795_3_plen_30_part_00